MRGDHLQFGRLAHNRKVRLHAPGGEGARAGLEVLLVNQSGEDNLGLRRTAPAVPPLADASAWPHRTFGVAGAASINSPPARRGQQRIRGKHGIQVRRQRSRSEQAPAG